MKSNGVPLDAFRRPLLEALEDPARFAAAHYLLYGLVRRPGRTAIPMYGPLTRQGDVFVLDQDGLRVEFPPPDGATQHRESSVPGVHVWVYYLDRPQLARIDPAQVPAVRDRWLLLLGRPLGSVPYWLVAAVAGVLPPAWLGTRLRRRVRRGRGLCASCGYDLRATPGRCPECGAPAAGNE